MCHTQHNSTTEADGCVTHIRECDAGGIHQFYRVITFGNTARVGLENDNLVLHPIINGLLCGRMYRGNTFGSTIFRCIVTNRVVISVPTIGKELIVVVGKIGRKNQITARADRINIMGNFHKDGIIHIDIVRFAGNSASSVIGSNHCEDVRLVSRLSFEHQCVMCIFSCTNCFVEESPFIIVGQTSNCVVEICFQHNHSIFTDNLIASNLDGRSREHVEGIGLHFRNTTAIFLRNHNTIDINCGVVRSSNCDFAEDGVISDRDFNTILVPSVSVSNTRNTQRISRNSGDFNLIAFANAIFVHHNLVNRGNSIHLDVSNLSGLTTGIKIRNRNSDGVHTLFVQIGSDQRGSKCTRHHFFINLPSVGNIGIRILNRSRSHSCTTVANSVFCNRDCHNLRSHNVDGQFITTHRATIRRGNNCLINVIVTCHRNIVRKVKLPTGRTCQHRNGRSQQCKTIIQIELDIIGRTIITRNLHCNLDIRVGTVCVIHSRDNNHWVGRYSHLGDIGNGGLASRSFSHSHNGVVMNRVVVVVCNRRDSVNAVGHTRNLLAVVKPSVGNRTQCGRNCRSGSGNKRNLTTFANQRIGDLKGDCRHLAHLDINVTCRGATSVGLVDGHLIGSISINCRSNGSLRGTRNFSTVGFPDVGQVRSIVVSDVSREDNFTCRANHRVRSRNHNLDGSRIAHIHIERIADGSTARNIIRDFDRENVRIFAAVIVFIQSVIVCSWDVGISKHPLISVSGCTNRIVHIGYQYNIVTIADDRITRDSNGVVRVNRDDRVNRGLDASRNFRNIDQRVVVSGDSTVNRNRRIRNCIQVCTRNHLTISIPCIGTAASDISGEGDFSTVTDNITRCKREVNRVKSNNCDRIITHCHTSGSGL